MMCMFSSGRRRWARNIGERSVLVPHVLGTVHTQSGVLIQGVVL